MTRAVGRRAGAQGLPLAVVQRHAAKGSLKYPPVLHARKWHAEMFQLVDSFGRTPAEIFDGVLIAQPVGALDGVVHVPAPIVLAHIAERGRYAPLRRHGMAAGGKDFGDAG